MDVSNTKKDVDKFLKKAKEVAQGKTLAEAGVDLAYART